MLAPAKPAAAPLAQPAANPNASAPLERPPLTACAPSQIGLDIVREDAPRWAQGRRDPFQIRSTPTKPVYPVAMEVLTLSAISTFKIQRPR